MYKSTTKFLIVDDSATTRKMNRNVMAELGYENIVEAADGVEAYQTLVDLSKSDAPVDFIISDWNMPNMHGIDFLKKCRSEKAFENIPFMLITVEREPSQILEAGKAGVTEYLVKPYNAETLKIKLENVFCKLNNLPLPERKKNLGSS